MRIGVNTPAGPPHGYAGHWERYMVRVLRACRVLQDDTRFVVYTHAQNHHLYEGCTRFPLDEVHPRLLPMRRGAALDHALKKHPVDYLLSPLTAPVAHRSVPQFLYALDLAGLERGERRVRGQASVLKHIRKACASVRGLIVSSEYLRHRCLDLLETPLDRVMVAPPGVDLIFEKAAPSLVEEPCLVLYIDALAKDSLPVVIPAMEQLMKDAGCNVAVVGPGCQGEPPCWGERAIRIERLPDPQLAGLYQHAAVFVYPCKNDGCALPVMEALRSRAPVVAPKSGAIPEFAHATPFYYNPDSPSSLLHAIHRTLEEKDAERRARTHQGRQAIADHTWEQCAWRLLSAFSRA